jgi:hypothetical protein
MHAVVAATVREERQQQGDNRTSRTTKRTTPSPVSRVGKGGGGGGDEHTLTLADLLSSTPPPDSVPSADRCAPFRKTSSSTTTSSVSRRPPTCQPLSRRWPPTPTPSFPLSWVGKAEARSACPSDTPLFATWTSRRHERLTTRRRWKAAPVLVPITGLAAAAGSSTAPRIKFAVAQTHATGARRPPVERPRDSSRSRHGTAHAGRKKASRTGSRVRTRCVRLPTVRRSSDKSRRRLESVAESAAEHAAAAVAKRRSTPRRYRHPAIACRAVTRGAAAAGCVCPPPLLIPAPRALRPPSNPPFPTLRRSS